MAGFSALRFEQYKRALSSAVFDLSRETMGATSEIRAALGIDNLSVRFGNNRKFVTMDDKTVELDASAPSHEVAAALNVDRLPVVSPVEPIKKNLTGASFLANLIRTQHAAIKKQLADAGTEMTVAMTELQNTANEATNQVKAVKAETADLKAALGLNSNGEPA